MRGRARSPNSGSLIAGRPCLDFVNTVSWRASAAPVEGLGQYRDLVAWSAAAGLVTAGRAAELERQAATLPASAEAVLERARALREALHRLFGEGAGGGAPGKAELAILNAELARAPAIRGLAWADPGFVWSGAEAGSRLESVLWPLAWSAAELLTGGDVKRVRACAGEGCGWLFYDTSRSLSRRWCAMDDCGNRAKARRHYARTKGRASREPARPT